MGVCAVVMMVIIAVMMLVQGLPYVTSQESLT
jgi:hypothetical protein